MALRKRTGAVLAALLAAVLCGQAYATVIDIDFNSGNFYADPTVTLAGSTATIREDATLFTVIISNDPGLGDPNLFLANDLVSFDYDFTNQPGIDKFVAFILDPLTGSPVSSRYFSTTADGQGSVSFDLSGFSLTQFGLQFELFDDDFATGSSQVTLSNLTRTFNTVSAPAPAPSIAMLMIMGVALSGVGWMARRGPRGQDCVV